MCSHGIKQEDLQAKLSADDFVHALQETLQVALSSAKSPSMSYDKQQSDPRIFVSMKQVFDSSAELNSGSVFNIKVSCSNQIQLVETLTGMPALCKFIAMMQDHDGESYLALQTLCEGGEDKRTSILWIERAAADDSLPAVHVMKETCKPVRNKDVFNSVIQIWVFLDVYSIYKAGKDVCFLLEGIKFLNPEVLLSFTLNTGNIVELDLRTSDSIESNGCLVFSKMLQSCFRKYEAHYKFEASWVECSETFELHFDNLLRSTSRSSSFAGKCVLYALPLHKLHSPLADMESMQAQERRSNIPLHIYIQIHGSQGFPFDVKNVTKKLINLSGSLSSLSKLGFQMSKMAAKSSRFHIQVSAQAQNHDGLPEWISACQRACLLFAFVIDDQNQLSQCVRSHLEYHRVIKNCLSTKSCLDVLQKTAESALLKMFGPLLPLEVSEQQAEPSPDLDECDTFIQDIVNSLTEIFTRSSSFQFRAEVSCLMPTSSRVSMSHHLEAALRKTIQIPSDAASQGDTLSKDSEEAEEEELDDWLDSDESTSSDPAKMYNSSQDVGNCTSFKKDITSKDITSGKLSSQAGGFLQKSQEEKDQDKSTDKKYFQSEKICQCDVTEDKAVLEPYEDFPQSQGSNNSRNNLTDHTDSVQNVTYSSSSFTLNSSNSGYYFQPAKPNSQQYIQNVRPLESGSSNSFTFNSFTTNGTAANFDHSSRPARTNTQHNKQILRSFAEVHTGPLVGGSSNSFTLNSLTTDCTGNGKGHSVIVENSTAYSSAVKRTFSETLDGANKSFKLSNSFSLSQKNISTHQQLQRSRSEEYHNACKYSHSHGIDNSHQNQFPSDKSFEHLGFQQRSIRRLPCADMRLRSKEENGFLRKRLSDFVNSNTFDQETICSSQMQSNIEKNKCTDKSYDAPSSIQPVTQNLTLKRPYVLCNEVLQIGKTSNEIPMPNAGCENAEETCFEFEKDFEDEIDCFDEEEISNWRAQMEI